MYVLAGAYLDEKDRQPEQDTRSLDKSLAEAKNEIEEARATNFSGTLCLDTTEDGELPGVGLDCADALNQPGEEVETAVGFHGGDHAHVNGLRLELELNKEEHCDDEEDVEDCSAYLG